MQQNIMYEKQRYFWMDWTFCRMDK